MTAAKRELPSITELLSWSRPHGSEIERRFVNSFVAPWAPSRDAFGNHYIAVGDAPRALFSCHTDTMCAYEGPQPLKRNKAGVLSLAKPAAGHCLGADDGAGIWLCLQMIEAQRPGLYVFHRGEERGGLGSKWIRDHNPHMLDGIEIAVAFDRKGTGDVITHQWCGRTASDDFAANLAAELNRHGLQYAGSNQGVFTDTANYADTVSECTNISVGYQREHGPTETLDMVHLGALRAALLRLDFAALVAYRDPATEQWSDDEGDLYDYVYQHPDDVVRFLEDHHVTLADLLDYERHERVAWRR